MVNATRHSSSVDIARRTESSFAHKLSSKTPVLGLKLYVVIGICLGCFIAAVILFLICFRSKRNLRRRRRSMRVKDSTTTTTTTTTTGSVPITLKEMFQMKGSSSTTSTDNLQVVVVDDEERMEKKKNKQIEEMKGFNRAANVSKMIDVGNRRSSESIVSISSPSSSSVVSVEVPNMGWGRWYTLRELELATGGFSDENVIGEGGYGVVYRGNLPDNSVVAVKNLLNKKGQAEKEFKVEVEVIGKVRHKNLVGLIGYCAEGVQRMLVYEYVDNGTLEQWLHGDVGPVSPLTWDIRIKIAIGTAKGIAYLHEGLEPKVVHRDIKSSNILLDRKWNAKVSDFGLAKLLESDSSYVTTRVMGTFGCVAPEYASTGMLNEGSDVYSFGVLLMELISGRSPVDYDRRAGEVNLVDWFKSMVSSRRGEEVLDPLIEVQPSSRALKRAILVCLRCIDLDAHKRPKMGQVVHMLEADEFPFRADNRVARETVPLLPTRAGPSVINRIPLPPKSAGER